MSESFLDGKVTLHRGDCLEVLRELPENSVDSVCCDPPYHLTSIVKRFGKVSLMSDQTDGNSGNTPFKRTAKGFMGKQWDGGDIAFQPLVWELVLRAIKPGGHLLAFGGTRTYHRMACAIEDAGFEIRDQIGWCYASGFPKSHDVSKGIDRVLGAERQIVSERPAYGIGGSTDCFNSHSEGATAKVSLAATESAIKWQGWGTALKPAWEPIVLARKPLSESSIAANVLRWGTGAINIDGCRVATDWKSERGETWLASGKQAKPDEQWQGPSTKRERKVIYANTFQEGFAQFRGGCWVNIITPEAAYPVRPDGSLCEPMVLGSSIKSTVADRISHLGRWPANLIHDGSEEVLAGFPESGGGSFSQSGIRSKRDNPIYGAPNTTRNAPDNFGDSGSAARFFYTAKADTDDRLGSKHPTVKPLDLIAYLVRLVTPRGGYVLDPFAGTGTTGEAAWREGCKAILIEREPEYQADIVKRMGLCLSGPDQRRAASVKQESVEDLPMFAGIV